MPHLLKLFAIITITFSAGYSFAALATAESDEFNGQTAPAFKFKAINGDEIDSAKLAGKPVVLSFLATWCIACQNQVKELNKLKDSGGVVIGVAVDSIADPVNSKPEDGPKDLKKFTEDEKTQFAMAVALKSLCDDYHFKGIPMMVVIGPDGNIAKYFYGKQPAEKIAKVVQSLVKAK